MNIWATVVEFPINLRVLDNLDFSNKVPSYQMKLCKLRNLLVKTKAALSVDNSTDSNKNIKQIDKLKDMINAELKAIHQDPKMTISRVLPFINELRSYWTVSFRTFAIN